MGSHSQAAMAASFCMSSSCNWAILNLSSFSLNSMKFPLRTNYDACVIPSVKTSKYDVLRSKTRATLNEKDQIDSVSLLQQEDQLDSVCYFSFLLVTVSQFSFSVIILNLMVSLFFDSVYCEQKCLVFFGRSENLDFMACNISIYQVSGKVQVIKTKMKIRFMSQEHQ